MRPLFHGKRMLLAALRKLYGALGLEVVRAGKIDRLLVQHDYMLSFFKRLYRDDTGSGIECVVFSKDRPLQLHGLLASYYYHVQDPCPVTVLYSASEVEYERAYQEVMDDFSEMDVSFCAERDFRHDLVGIIRQIESARILFLVDDILFTRALCFENFEAIDLERYVPSLRLGTNLTRCYTVGCDQSLPELEPADWLPGRLGCYQWKWQDGEYDWKYPLSLDGNIFSTREISLMLEVLDYSSPNTLEAAMQCFIGSYMNRLGLCLEKSVIVNLPYNKVQNDNDNICGAITEAEMLDLWNRGMMIDVSGYAGMDNISAHQEAKLLLASRSH